MLSDIMQRNTEIMEEWCVLLYHLGWKVENVGMFNIQANATI